MAHDELARRLMKVLVRMLDENDGTRVAAWHGFCKTVEREGFDVREWRLVRDDSDLAEENTDVIKRQGREIDNLKTELIHLRRETAKREQELAAKVAAQDAEIARLWVFLCHTNHAYEKQIAELEAELARLRPQKDHWQDTVAEFLKREVYDGRVASAQILENALGIKPEDQDTEAGRRLSRVMAAIGGWKPSTNVKFGGRAIRGYIKI